MMNSRSTRNLILAIVLVLVAGLALVPAQSAEAASCTGQPTGRCCLSDHYGRYVWDGSAGSGCTPGGNAGNGSAPSGGNTGGGNCTVAVGGDTATKIAQRLGCASYTCLGLTNPNMVYAGTTYCSASSGGASMQVAAPVVQYQQPVQVSQPAPVYQQPVAAAVVSAETGDSCPSPCRKDFLGCWLFVGKWWADGRWVECPYATGNTAATTAGTTSSGVNYEYQFDSNQSLENYLSSIGDTARKSWEEGGHHVLIGSVATGGAVMLIKLASAATIATAGAAWAVIGGVAGFVILALIEFYIYATGR